MVALFFTLILIVILYVWWYSTVVLSSIGERKYIKMSTDSKMTVVYALEEPPEQYDYSIFLAGPTPRSNGVDSWRTETLQYLEQQGYTGVVYVPEDRSRTFHGDYLGQVDWENKYLNMCDTILFWVPRDMQTLPGLTTNTEFGRWENSGKIVLGAPPAAEHVRYLIHHANIYKAAVHNDPLDTVIAAMQLHTPALRANAEREVPLHIWNTESFQRWYANLLKVGNRLDGAKLLWNFRTGPNKDKVFCWVLHVNVYVASEDRNKINEFVLARPDISTILMYHRREPLGESLVVLVREFRSPVNNTSGFVWELPGGSSHKPGVSPEELAAEECQEETGMALEPHRFVQSTARQLAATFSTHKAHLFCVELSDDEVQALRDDFGNVHGVEADSERTFVEVLTYDEILAGDFVDWSTIGMIAQVLH